MPPKVVKFKADTPGERLDVALVMNTDGLSRAQLQALIKDGQVTVDGQIAKPALKLRGGEIIRVTMPEAEADDRVSAQNIPLDVLYEDEVLAVINKPAGLVVHPGDGNADGTLVNALLARYPDVGQIPYDARRRGIVHRLDKETSGVILVARTAPVQRALMEQFSTRTVEKFYTAFVERTPKTLTGRIEAPIARDSNQRKRMAIVRAGKPAITEYTVKDTDFNGGQALLEVQIFTGRTHQIRVHLAFIGSPVVGDRVYGFRKQRVGLKRHWLHAARLTFDHPISGQRLTFEAPLPAELTDVLAKLR
jgi:23S rRNA pseudouridine1911/1915/1917 synthase